MASNTIKGLTVEIGGDTTKLGKALEGVNKKSRDLSAELGEINKLLKMDPGNTELLAQKQKVLADAVANTGEKLKTLKEAEKQVQKQFERGEVSEEQVRALQREIIQTEKKMESYKRASKETADEIDELGDEAKKTAVELDNAGDQASSFGDKAKAAGKVAVAGFAAVAAAVAAAGAALVAVAEDSREYRTEMGKLDTAFTTAGHSSEVATKTYKSLQGVLGETDQAVEAANHLAQLTENEQDLEKWTNICAGVYATFGASLPIEGLTEAANETAKVGQVTGPLADALNWAGVSEDAFNESLAACSNEQERQTLIMETLNGLYDEAATKYQETNAEVIRANQANEEWAAVMAEVGGAVDPVLSDVKLLGASLVQELVPGIQDVVGAFRAMLNGEEGAEAGLGQAVGDMFGSIITKVAELIPTIVQVGQQVGITLATSIVAELPNLVTSITQVLIDSIPVLLEGTTTLLMSIVDAIDLILPPLIEAIPLIIVTLVDGLVSAIPDLIEGAISLLSAIISAIPLFIEQLLPRVPVIVDSIISGLLGALPVLVDGAVQLLMGILKAIPEIQKALIAQAPAIVRSIVTGLLKAVPELIKAGGQLLEGLIKGMLDFDILGAISGIADSIVSGFKSLFGIHSPSRVMAELGEMLDAGLAVGIKDNAGEPVQEIGNLSDNIIDEAGDMNGLTLERRLVHAFNPNTTATPADGLSKKLDQIYQAILRGQVIMLDGKALVGSTADRYDTELGQRRVLAERGAI